MDNNLFQVIADVATPFAAFGSCAAVYVALRTLKELQRQREVSHKPQLIITDQRFIIPSSERKTFGTNDWVANADSGSDGKEIQIDEFSLELFNIGKGAARSVQIKWQCNLEGLVKEINDIAQRKMIGLHISLNEKFLHINASNGLNRSYDLRDVLNPKHNFVLPSSIDANPQNVCFPNSYRGLVGMFLYVQFYDSLKVDEIKDTSLELPEFKCEISFQDIAGKSYVTLQKVKPVLTFASLIDKENVGMEFSGKITFD